MDVGLILLAYLTNSMISGDLLSFHFIFLLKVVSNNKNNLIK